MGLSAPCCGCAGPVTGESSRVLGAFRFLSHCQPVSRPTAVDSGHGGSRAGRSGHVVHAEGAALRHAWPGHQVGVKV